MRTRGLRTYHRIERVHYGAGSFGVIPDEAARLGATRVLALVSTTLRRNTDLVERLSALLGDRLAGIVDGIPAHTPRAAVIEVAAKARESGADLILTLGGGSVMDCGQLVRLCLEHDVRRTEQLDDFRAVVRRDGTRHVPQFRGPSTPQIAVATTLSAAEFNPILGCTDVDRGVKDLFTHPGLAAQVIILDPEVCRTTPQRLWLSSGIRAVDHCIETLAAPLCDDYSVGPALHGLKLLARSLPATRADPADLAARHDSLMGAWLAADHTMAAIPMGASHGIGHMLGGALGMAHGDTSCVMLPATLAYNLDWTRDAQALVSATMGRPGEPAADVVREFVQGLGLPTRLSELGVGREVFPSIAAAAMESHYLYNNPRPIRSEAQVMELLELAL